MVRSGGKLLGEYSHSIDSKKRIFIPVDFRVSKTWVVTAGLEECLFLFSQDEWEKITDKIKNLPLIKKNARSFLRIFLSRAKIISCDSQGRIILPQNLVKYAQLSRSCTVIGMLNRIELWNPRRWVEYFQKSQKNYSEHAENIAELEL